MKRLILLALFALPTLGFASATQSSDCDCPCCPDCPDCPDC